MFTLFYVLRVADCHFVCVYNTSNEPSLMLLILLHVVLEVVGRSEIFS